MIEAAPFLKWAGGKRWLVGSEQLSFPASFNRYFEPFLGGGAVFFSLKPRRAVLSDINEALIDAYRAVRDAPQLVEQHLAEHQRLHSKEYYYEVRSKAFDDRVEAAAQFIYLNRTCWNGLYRVNLRGQFNVPIGTKSKISFNTGEILAVSKALDGVDISCGDFEKFINDAEKEDLVFVDPPYTANHNLNGFLKYNENIFSWEDQVRLRSAVERAVQRGAFVVVTNADHASVRELYSGICDYRAVERASVLSGKREARRQTTEALFTANF